MNFLAAPFNGLLAEKVERYESGEALGDEGFMGLIKDIPRTVGREFQKRCITRHGLSASSCYRLLFQCLGKCSGTFLSAG